MILRLYVAAVNSTWLVKFSAGNGAASLHVEQRIVSGMMILSPTSLLCLYKLVQQTKTVVHCPTFAGALECR